VRDPKQVFEELAGLVTEASDPAFANLDRLSAREILERMNDEDARVAPAVRAELAQIERASDLAYEALRGGGRLIYAGAGTSGRLGVLDAAECPPTFGTDPRQVVGVIAGGHAALSRAVEGAEDRDAEGEAAMDALDVGAKDVVVGLAASRRTPFTLAAVARARGRGARTVYITTNPRSERLPDVDVAICPVVGAEIVAGSTRLKSATAQKMILNMISTSAMVRLGKLYGNLMVDLMAASEKLRERSKRVIMVSAGIDYEAAERALDAASGSVKRAIVMARAGVEAGEADRMLAEAGGFVRTALERAGR
jgi:N-acetylmuramic acid 6-phosphate etherase